MANSKRRFRVLLNASASIHGYLTVDAASAEEAKRLAVENAGNVDWQYDGADDDTISALEATEEVRGDK